MYNDIITRFLRRHDYMEVRPEAALIDMDGTLYDSMPGHAAAWQQMMREYGVEIERQEFLRHEGRTGRATIDLLFRRYLGRPASDEEKEALYRRKTEIFAAMQPPRPMEGAAEILRFMEGVGMTRVLVTGSGQNSLLNRLDSDYPGAFTAGLRVTSRDVTHGKPHPEPFLKGLELAGVRPDRCIVLENAPLGVEAADKAGIFTIAVNTGNLPENELWDAGAAIVFPSMTQAAAQFPILVYGLLTTSLNLN